MINIQEITAKRQIYDHQLNESRVTNEDDGDRLLLIVRQQIDIHMQDINLLM